jgi:chitinase
VAVPISDDAVAEGVESFSLALSNPNGASLSGGAGTVWIGASDASASSQPAISSPPDVIVSEGDGYVDLPVTLSAPSTNTVSVRYNAVSGSASGNNGCNADFAPRVGILTFLPGETTKVARVNLYDCADPESYEQFFLQLDLATNGVITRSQTTVGIDDNDTVVATPALTVRNTTVDEKGGFALVSVLLGGLGREGTSVSSQTSNSSVTVDYATSDGTAAAGSDYTATSGTLTFAPHESAKTIVVPITADGLAEGAESFALGL